VVDHGAGNAGFVLEEGEGAAGAWCCGGCL